jgi:hypothetical protein
MTTTAQEGYDKMAAMNTDQGLVPDPSIHPDRPADSRPRGRGPLRWLVAGIATVLLVVSGTGLVAFAQTGAGSGRGPIFVPEDAPIYVEARIDMPDGQDAALAEMLTAFPGFADSASFPLRVDEALNGIVSDATDGEVSFSEDLSPWLTGEIGVAVTGLPDDPMREGSDPDILVGVGVSDPAAASAFITEVASGSEMPPTEEEYEGFGIVVADDAALTVADDFLLIGTSVDLIKQSIDVLAGTEPSLAQSEEFQASWARVPAGHLAALWFDVESFADLITAAMSMTGQPGPAGMAETILAQLPQDMTAYLAAAPDGLTVEAFITAAEGGTMPAVGESDLASLFPSSTQIYAETRDLGSTLRGAIEGLMAQVPPEGAEDIEGLEGLLGVPLPQALDFVEDAALGGAIDEGGIWIGVAGEVTDEEVANDRLERLLGLIGMLASQSDEGIEITEADVAGTTVTTITLPSEAGDDAEMFGLPLDVGSLSVAIDDGTLLFGTGDFVTDALEGDGTDSLATTEGYTSALAGSTPNVGVIYADIGAILTTLDPVLAFVVDDWEDISPWVSALDRFVAVGSADDSVISARLTLYVD